jgi:DNA end-binding protein Ku
MTKDVPMPKAVWTGSLSLGLVTIPVSLYAATEPKDVRFHLVDRAGRRVRYRRFVDVDGDADDQAASRVASQEDPGPDTAFPGGDAEGTSIISPVSSEIRDGQREVEVPYEDLMRGFEVDRDRLVTLDPQEIERARPQPSRTIELEHFVRLEQIDPIYFEKSYYLAPRYGSHAGKPYVLLLRAMQDAGHVGIGRFVLRTKPHLVAIRAAGDVMALETLFFGDEVRDPREIASWLQGIDVERREIEMAQQLIAMLATEWDPAAYADEYRGELLRLIAEKTPIDVDREPEDVEGSAVEDLMAALKASVEAARKETRSPKTKRSRAG